MDVEETKKIIQSKIEAEAVTKNVRIKIKSYIHEKQNVREGFKDSFEPLISSQDKVKESIDKEQNALFEQLQKNQLALTEGLEKNQLAITQGFDKMDEVKKWDLNQLPGYETIEEPEAIEEPEEFPKYEKYFLISNKDLNKIEGYDLYPDNDELVRIEKNDLDKIIMESDFSNQKKYEINIINEDAGLLKVMNKPIIVTYDKNEIDKNFMNKESTDLLSFFSLKLPSEYKDKKFEGITRSFEKKSRRIVQV